ncbi:uncharacterized protein CLUP02_12518 [Colletotrichum lupini]|uniref:Uncharacterized protein n=2 Tax=Colletotrichum acutatum species complex TaxID=2707335 RepID=A0A9Q8T0M9_9PEZI|nr:uncharacterized protein CLUP02_12518 [Colletotrichum lupini]XP_060304596.1 uncharacterized protein CCOS01_16793 [Colletotrichum costaricense]KAI3548493.1 hypothetical protein CSPX01_02922 [Colletotrichum filicis]KAK1505219.1 hypothetical protein CCOS01_16793 [Colletotrichum costaricense]UQC87016.1 hypothetical protein CLUP02_12518 [Colletotrichum lupini]
MGFRVHADVLMQEKTSMLPEKIFKGPNSGFGNPRVMYKPTELLSSNARVNVASNSIVNCRSVPGVITVRPSESTPRSSGSSIEP